MRPFLQQVAAHYYASGDIGQNCFVFPNRRSMVFFRKYLGDLVREKGAGVPLQVPAMFTISDFFQAVTKVQPGERLRLLLELYGCYKELNPATEPLDEFIFWGDVILADFNDVDKYLADARAVFGNVKDLKAIQDNYDYLSENQRHAIESFLSHFRDGKESIMKDRFLKIWNILYPLYTAFRSTLREKGMAYEGMVYRALADEIKGGKPVVDILEPVFPEVRQYVFVGLNALTECERLLLSRMRDAGIAQFVWDYVSGEIRDKANKSSLFMQKNVEQFPQAFPTDTEGLVRPEVTVVSVPSSVGQAKLAPEILAQVVGGDPVETAFVLPDENLLLPLLNSIPPEWDSVNVTMGYPMSGSAVYTLLQALSQLQLRFRKRPEGWYFYHRPVREVFSSGLFRSLISEEEARIVAKVKAAAKYYIPLADLQGGPVLDLIFRPVIQDTAAASALQNHKLEKYFSDIVAHIGRAVAANGDLLLELDFAKRCHTQLNILQDIDLELLPSTYLRLLQRILEGISVPFRGEPLKGLQVMGPLETRALDFRNLVIMSANEGVFPRKSSSSSFIPSELRRSFGLPTNEYQDAVWAYYFYRLIQRAQKVWIVYDSRTEGLKTGEESRYVKQLQYHFSWPLKRLVAAAAMYPVNVEEEIEKTEEDVKAVREGLLSATSLQYYQECPVKFYYSFIKKLKMEEEVAESLDAGMQGTVFHKTMETLYGIPEVKVADIRAMLADEPRIRRIIRANVIEKMKCPEVTGRNLVLEEVILDYVRMVLKYDLGLLSASGSPGFKVLGLEKYCETAFDGFHIKGFVDRMDSYLDGEVRVVDYKTGKVDKDKIALQLFVYDLFVHANPAFAGQTVVNSIYSIRSLYTNPLPDAPEDPELSAQIADNIRTMLVEMTDLGVPFRRTREKASCEKCNFKIICGR